MRKPSPSKGSNFHVLDTLVWLWLVLSMLVLVAWRSPASTIVATAGGLLLIGASLWVYRRAGGTWVRLIVGLLFIFSVIFVAVW